jgi:hypothetical protein
LQCFLTSMLLDMLLVAPITVLFKSVMLPKVVAKLVFDEPDLAPLAATPLMTGAVSQFVSTVTFFCSVFVISQLFTLHRTCTRPSFVVYLKLFYLFY